MNKIGLFKYSNHLGAFNPFYFKDQNGFKFDQSFKGIINKYNEPIELDVTAIVSVLNKHYILGDRTLIKGIKRSPWMAYPDKKNSAWKFHKLPAHGSERKTAEEVSEKVFQLFCGELEDYLHTSKSVGILLSGGMDSRMVAGVLDYLIKNKRTRIKRVVAYTWGNESSRDVVYSKKIANRLGWEWQHFFINESKLKRNFEIAGMRGCEYSGLHLHGMPDIANAADVDVVLAGSYGDSVGRAEYSGSHVTELKPIDSGIRNFAYLINKQFYNMVKGNWKKDVEKYDRVFPRNKDYQKYELERQLHYMRRMLNPCMEVIHEKVPLRQAFTSPALFGYMWSLSPACRNNDLYKYLPKYFETDLSDIPWARTGLPYGKKSGTPDDFNKKHHSYSYYMQEVLLDHIYDKINGSNLSVINKKQSLKLINLIRKQPYHNFDYLEAIAWVYSFCVFIDEYDIENVEREDVTNVLSNILLTAEYSFKRNARKVKSFM